MSFLIKIKDFLILLIGTLLLAIFLTFVYAKIPPFYISSFNFSVIPSLEYKDEDFSYNGYYQTVTSIHFTKNLALFASQADFKKKVSSDLKTPIFYVLSKTNGDSLLNIKFVTLHPLELKNTELVLKSYLQDILGNLVPKGLVVDLNSLNNYNQTYTAGISYFKFFTLVWALLLIFGSSLLILKNFYYESTR